MPKGAFKIDVADKPEGKYLFEIHAETLLRANTQYGVTIPWYIMTSRENSKQTEDFLKEHDYFGYPIEYLKIFQQEELPLLDVEGKFVIDKNSLVKKASNGNGGVFSSLEKHGLIEDMHSRGVKWIFIGGVDNVLLKMVDTNLIGLCLKNKTDIAAKTVLKNSPEEKAGVFCKQNGKIRIIEYTEMPKDLSEKVKEDGELVFGEINIISNLFSVEAVGKAATQDMPYHVAFKKGCYKFEKFIFDAFALFDNISILRGAREHDFAPIKNATGVDSPQTAVELYDNYWR